MTKRSFWFVCYVAASILVSCQSPTEVVSPIPAIEVVDFRFGSGGSILADTLQIKFKITDGDGNMGEESTTVDGYRTVFDKKTGQFVPYADDSTNLIQYRDRRTNDTLPALGCGHWFVTYGNGIIASDTIYYQYNRNYFNFQADLYYQDGANWVQYDPLTSFSFPNCFIVFADGLIPPLQGNVSAGPFTYTPRLFIHGGLMTYSLTSALFKLMFGGKNIKIKFHVRDRAMNNSNIAETPTLMMPPL
jgi:hypothetical protein